MPRLFFSNYLATSRSNSFAILSVGNALHKMIGSLHPLVAPPGANEVAALSDTNKHGKITDKKRRKFIPKKAYFIFKKNNKIIN